MNLYKTSNIDQNKYFANEEPKEMVNYLMTKSANWFDTLTTSRYLDKIKRSWNAYFGIFYEDNHAITFGGETGELTNIAVNHYRNFGQHMLNMTTSNRPVFQAKAVNTDYKSQVQTTLANGILEYYMREKRMEVYLKKTVEFGIAMGSGFMKMGWNATSGKIHDWIEPAPVTDDEGKDLKNEDGELIDKQGNVLEPIPIYEGDIEFTNLSPFDVVFDVTKESPEKQDWVLVRTFKNKFDLAAKYPDMAEEILKIPTKSEKASYRISLSPLEETVDVAVYEFYHKRTEAMPQGKYTLYLSDECVLDDGPMPYKRLPVYRLAPSDILGTAFGYSPLFDLLPLQDAVNSEYSAILSNHNAFAVQNILNPAGNDVKVSQVEGALNWIEYNPIPGLPNGGKPEPFNPTKTPAEVFNYLDKLERSMETISGINGTTRGTPDANLRSGNALALVQSMSLQFISGLQNSYVRLIEDVGSGLIEILQDYAQVPRMAQIVGKTNRSKLVEFKSDDISDINLVTVDVGNALAHSAAGRAEMAQNLIQMGLIETPEQYFSVLNTGNLDTMTESYTSQLQLVKNENEALVAGEEVMAIDVDDHRLHILEHRCVLSNPALRTDAELVSRTLAHIQEHLDALRTVDPDLLMMMQEQPLAPKQAQGGQPQGQPAQGGVNPVALEANPEAQAFAAQSGVDMPSLPEPPVDPATGLPLQAMNRPLGSL